MIEGDFYCDTPIEAQVIAPKVFTVRNDFSPSSRSKQAFFTEIYVTHLLSEAKFPVYLVKCNGQNYAMKVFCLEEAFSQLLFVNEGRFISLNHPNILKIVHIEREKSISWKNSSKKIAFILTEYAKNGDLYNFLIKNKEKITDKLIRTFFRQLMEGIEYLHKIGIAHLDLKLENLLLDENFKLKIADFDLSCFSRDIALIGKGTLFYRAPELITSECQNTSAADIYSAGIILFILKSKGAIPHSENMLFKGINLFTLLNNNNSEFWKVHCEIQGKESSFFSEDFKTLFNGMTLAEPEKRFSISEIKGSAWYNGPVYTLEEMKEMLNNF